MNSTEILKRLVAFDTTSSRSNLEMIAWIEDYLSAFDIYGTRVLSPEQDKANFYATVGPQLPGGVLLSGHSDVVPVEGQIWTSDPWTLTARDGLLYGRGTSDMKAFIACALAAVPAMLKAGLTRPVHLAFSYDEEVGCRGVAPMITQIAEKLPPISAVIVGEPTMMGLVNGHKSITALRTQVTGKAAHSSQTQLGVSAVMVAGELIAQLQGLARKLQHQRDEDFEPAWTTLTVNRIEGGTAINILAQDCWFEWDIRGLPTQDVDGLLSEFEGICDEVASRQGHPVHIETSLIAQAPGLTPTPDNAAEALIRRLTGANAGSAVAYATEAGLFQNHGFDTIICGPGDIAQAHQPDEFIAPEQIAACDIFLSKLIAYLASAA